MTLFLRSELQPITLRVSSAPTYSALVGMAALGTADQRDGLSAAELSAEEYALTRTVFDVLGAALLPADPEQEFEAYLASLEALAPDALRDRALAAPLSRSADRADTERAIALLADPPHMQATIVAHLRSIWRRLLADEWRRKGHLIAYIQRAIEERGVPLDDAPTALRALLGRELPPAVAADLGSVRSIVLVPSPFVQLRAVRPEGPATLWVFAALSTLTSWALRQGPLSPGEIQARVSPLADAARLRIVELLAQHGELSAQQLIVALGLSQSVVSRHLSSLGGYVLERRGEGASKLYRLDPQHIEWTLVMLQQFAMSRRHPPTVSLEPATTSYPPELRRFMRRDGRLTQLPTREQDRVAALRFVAERIPAGRDYSEREINQAIQASIAYDDFVTLRRMLFEGGYIGRKKNGSRYWVNSPLPDLPAWSRTQVG